MMVGIWKMMLQDFARELSYLAGCQSMPTCPFSSNTKASNSFKKSDVNHLIIAFRLTFIVNFLKINFRASCCALYYDSAPFWVIYELVILPSGLLGGYHCPPVEFPDVAAKGRFFFLGYLYGFCFLLLLSHFFCFGPVFRFAVYFVGCIFSRITSAVE